MKTAKEIAEWSHNWKGAQNDPPPSGIKDWDTYSYQELVELAERTLELPEGAVIVEIGCYIGRSSSVFLQVAEQKNLDITLIDPFAWNPEWARRSFNHLIGDHFPDVRFRLMEMDSGSAMERWCREQFHGHAISLLHIDGNHTFHGVDTDCSSWLGLLGAGGVALFHDYNDPRDRGVTINVDYWCYGWEGYEVERLAVRRKPRS